MQDKQEKNFEKMKKVTKTQCINFMKVKMIV